METKKNPEARSQMKFGLTRRLYEKGYGRDYVLNLLKVIDWILVIPEHLELEYKSKVRELEEIKNMSYVTSFERLSREEGRQEGRYEIIKVLLENGMSIEEVRKLTKLPDLNSSELDKI